EESKGKGRVVSQEQVKRQMVRITAQADAKGRPVIRVDNEPVSVLQADERTVNVAALSRKIAEKVKGPPRREEALLEARGITWGTAIAIQDAARDAGIRHIHYPKK